MRRLLITLAVLVLVAVACSGGVQHAAKPTTQPSTTSSVAGYRNERYRGVALSVPRALARYAWANVSTCDVVARPGVYSGPLFPGKCVMQARRDLLSVRLSPLDAATSPITRPGTRHEGQGLVLVVRVVKTRRVAVGLWFGRARRGDAARMLASIHPT